MRRPCLSEISICFERSTLKLSCNLHVRQAKPRQACFKARRDWYCSCYAHDILFIERATIGRTVAPTKLISIDFADQLVWMGWDLSATSVCCYFPLARLWPQVTHVCDFVSIQPHRLLLFWQIMRLPYPAIVRISFCADTAWYPQKKTHWLYRDPRPKLYCTQLNSNLEEVLSGWKHENCWTLNMNDFTFLNSILTWIASRSLWSRNTKCSKVSCPGTPDPFLQSAQSMRPLLKHILEQSWSLRNLSLMH